jgi:hypothetical protein
MIDGLLVLLWSFSRCLANEVVNLLVGCHLFLAINEGDEFIDRLEINGQGEFVE